MRNVVFVLFSLFFFYNSIQAQDGYCDPNHQWVEHEHVFPTGNHGVRYMDVYNGELYALTQKISNTYTWQIYKLDTINGWKYITEIGSNCIMYSFGVYDGNLYVGNACSNMNDTIPGNIAMYNGVKWQSVGLDTLTSKMGIIWDFQIYNGDLYVTGNLGAPYNGIARFDGTKWHPLLRGLENADSKISTSLFGKSLTIFEGKLYVGGSFIMDKEAVNHSIAAWDGTSWHNVPGVDREISSLHATDTSLVAWAPYAQQFGSLSTPFLSYLKGGKWHKMGLHTGDWLGWARFADINNQIYVYTTTGSSSRLSGNQIDGVARYENGKWKRMSAIKKWGNNDVISYKGRLIISHPESSCGTPIKGLGVLCDTTICASLSGRVFIDENENCADENEKGIPNPPIQISKNRYAIGDKNGNWRAFLSNGDYNIRYKAPKWYSNNCNSAGINVSLKANEQRNELNFPIASAGFIKDLEIAITVGRARVGFPTSVYVSATNIGTTNLVGSLDIKLDTNLLKYLDASIPVTSTSGNVSWKFDTLKPFEVKRGRLNCKVPANINLMGSTIKTSAAGNIIGKDADHTNNSDTNYREITAAYDPNEKEVYPKGKDTVAIKGAILLKATNTFTYTIHFQNTGNDTAFNVLLKDTLDSNLDLTTLRWIDASHYMHISIENRVIEFNFDNILLPDSGTNYKGSEGFVKYQISTKSGLTHGTKIHNSAAIYFDFNPPIFTNRVTNTLISYYSSIKQLDASLFSIYPNPTKSSIKIDLNKQYSNSTINIKSIIGQIVTTQHFSNINSANLSLNNLEPGTYFVEVVGDGISLGNLRVIKF